MGRRSAVTAAQVGDDHMAIAARPAKPSNNEVEEDRARALLAAAYGAPDHAEERAERLIRRTCPDAEELLEALGLAQPAEPDTEWLTVTQAAAWARVGNSAVRRWIQLGTVHARHTPQGWRVAAHSLSRRTA